MRKKQCQQHRKKPDIIKPIPPILPRKGIAFKNLQKNVAHCENHQINRWFLQGNQGGVLPIIENNQKTKNGRTQNNRNVKIFFHSSKLGFSSRFFAKNNNFFFTEVCGKK